MRASDENPGLFQANFRGPRLPRRGPLSFFALKIRRHLVIGLRPNPFSDCAACRLRLLGLWRLPLVLAKGDFAGHGGGVDIRDIGKGIP